MFAVGVGGFGAASLLCALAPSIGLLIAFRAVQGVAGALLTPSSLAVIVATSPRVSAGRRSARWSRCSSAHHSITSSPANRSPRGDGQPSRKPNNSHSDAPRSPVSRPTKPPRSPPHQANPPSRPSESGSASPADSSSSAASSAPQAFATPAASSAPVNAPAAARRRPARRRRTVRLRGSLSCASRCASPGTAHRGHMGAGFSADWSSAGRVVRCLPERAALCRLRVVGSRWCPRRWCRAWRRDTTSRRGSP